MQICLIFVFITNDAPFLLALFAARVAYAEAGKFITTSLLTIGMFILRWFYPDVLTT